MTLIDYFIQGGPVMYLILLSSVLGLAVFIERFIYLRNFLICGSTIMGKIRERANNYQIDEAKAECDNNPGPASNIIKAGIEVSGSPVEVIEVSMESAAKLEISGINRFVPILATVSSVSTLLGLLGSVLGMINSGTALTGLTEGAAGPSRLIGGIARSLIATAFGLCVAIPAVAGYNYITAKINAVLSEIESWTADFIKIAGKRPERSKW